MNIDTPTKRCVIHSDKCSWANRIHSEDKAEYKGIEAMERDGGWFQFMSVDEANNCYALDWRPQGYELTTASRCLHSKSV